MEIALKQAITVHKEGKLLKPYNVTKEAKIRIHNKQNILFVFLIFINSIIKNPLKFLLK